jgi:hypothetical protein
VELWVRIESTKSSGHYHTLVSNSRDDLSDGFIVSITAGDNAGLTFAANTSDKVELTGSVTLTHGAWYHVVATFDDAANVARLYVNGVEDVSGAWTSSIFYDPARGLRLAEQVKALNRGLRYLDGRLDEVAIYSRALTLAEIEAHYFVGTDVTPPDTALTSLGSPGYGLSSDDPEAVFECQLDGAGWARCQSPVTLGPLSPGSHQLEARAVDRAGNVDPSPASLTVSDSPPSGLSLFPYDVGCGCHSGGDVKLLLFGLVAAWASRPGGKRRRRAR